LLRSIIGITYLFAAVYHTENSTKHSFLYQPRHYRLIMSQSRNITHVVTKVPNTYRTAAPRYWCNHCSDSYDSKVMVGIHYQECHPEHIGECASWEGWSKQSYQQTRHAGNESEWEGEDQGEGDVHDECSDEEDTRDESAKGMRVGPIPANVRFPSPKYSFNNLLTLLQHRQMRNQTKSIERNSEITSQSQPWIRLVTISTWQHMAIRGTMSSS
jgi:hypothetical protein